MLPPMKWRGSHTSIESLASPGPFEATPKPKRVAGVKEKKPKSTTPDLPDSTDFVCGTLDEDRSIEFAYISRMEERRRQKHIPIPQDIDPSFPTSDPEDDDEDAEDDDVSAKPTAARKQQGSDVDNHVEAPRGRRSSRTNIDKAPNAVPHSPRRLFGHSPRRLRSPPPPGRLRSPPPSRRTSLINPPNMGTGPSAKMITIALAERPNRTRTSSLPRTPNPFFTRAYTSHNVYKRTSRSPSPCPKSSTTKNKRNPTHTRGPIDIVAGLEKKRQKRKEKFWRQHCRRAAKEQNLHRDRVVPGRGAERMKELGLEVAERFRAYGVGMGGNGPKLVLSI
ncbi:hypothetical protein FQN49_007603 [Arthroderma sp. PD_2]|nr:hypothetical protein FQN49_007603 [Arthroderma sp. PD_2]